MRGRHLGCVPHKEPPIHAPPPGGGGLSTSARLGTAQLQALFAQAKAASIGLSPPQRRSGDPCGPRHGLNPHPALRSPSRRSRKEGNPRGWGAQDAEEGQRRWGRGVGTWWCWGRGDWGGNPTLAKGGTRGRGRSWGAEAPPRGGTAAGPVIRLAARPGPAQRQGLGESPPLLPCPGLEPSPTRVAGDGAEAAAASRPSLSHHPSHPRWTSGPWAPHRQGSGNPPRPAPRPGPHRPHCGAPSPPPD